MASSQGNKPANIVVKILLATAIVAASGTATVFALNTFVKKDSLAGEAQLQTAESARDDKDKAPSEAITTVVAEPGETRETRCYTIVAPKDYQITTVNEADCSATLSSLGNNEEGAIMIASHTMPMTTIGNETVPLYTSLAEHHMGVIEKTLDGMKAKIISKEQISRNELKIGHYRYVNPNTNNEVIMYIMDNPDDQLLTTTTNEQVGSFQVTGSASSPESVASAYLVAKNIRQGS